MTDVYMNQVDNVDEFYKQITGRTQKLQEATWQAQQSVVVCRGCHCEADTRRQKSKSTVAGSGRAESDRVAATKQHVA